MPFSMLGLSAALCTPLRGLGYVTPTPVQSESIPLVLGGGDVIARALTGTGKTAAFGLPMIDRLLVRTRARAQAPRGLVLVPTRELAIQVTRALATYGAPVRLRVTTIVGGMPMRPQVEALRRGTDILVATPGRLIDHLQQRTVSLSAVEILTLDEADRMLDMGFLPPLRKLLAALPRARQTLLFSATLPPPVVQLAREFTREPVHVDVAGKQAVATTVVHHAHPVADGRKGELLAHVVTQEPAAQVLVFCRTKRRSDRVGRGLAEAGIATAVIHGNKSQPARTRALGDFKAGRVAVLVATDIAARGLDIAELPLVVNYDLPLVPDDYVHRVGRTGRAGLAGRAVSLVGPDERDLLRDIQRLLPSTLEQVVVAGFEVEDATAGRTDAPHRPAFRAAGRGRPGHRAGARRSPQGESGRSGRRAQAASAPRHGRRAAPRS